MTILVGSVVSMGESKKTVLEEEIRHMKIYPVGGSVRDKLLARSIKDNDYVVVGSSPEEMIEAGYKPVGKDFPVFLCPAGEEYALAHTEQKVATGYHGFSFRADQQVTLEQDLA